MNILRAIFLSSLLACCLHAGGVSNAPSAGAMASISSIAVNTSGFLVVTMSDGTVKTSAQQVAPALASVATSGAYTDLSGRPSLGTAASADTSAFATAAQGTLANTALQPSAVATTSAVGVIKQAATLTNTGASTLTNNSGGTVGTTVAAIGTLFNQTTLANNFAVLTDALNRQKAQQDELIANLKTSGALKP